MNLNQWEPFIYICEDFEGNTEQVGGFFPIDVREKCSFNINHIHGPVIKGFWSWCMFRLVKSGNNPPFRYEDYFSKDGKARK